MATEVTIVTWVGARRGDAVREATRLVSLHKGRAILVPLKRLSRYRYSSSYIPFNVIVVGHRSDIVAAFEELVEALRDVASWVTLAACDSGVKKYHGPLGDNDLLSPGQKLANRLRIKVSVTTRPLLFDEVGQGIAFDRSGLINIILRTNYEGYGGIGRDLWRDLDPQEEVEELGDMLSGL